MKVQLQQELAWSAEGFSILLGSRGEARRLFVAGGGSESRFEQLWPALERWMSLVRDQVEQGRYHNARGFVMVLTCGRAV